MPKSRTIAVSGMTSAQCETNVETALRNVPGVRRVEADHGDETVEIVVEDDVNDEQIGDLVYDAGYEFVG